jgi:hypothetical protein
MKMSNDHPLSLRQKREAANVDRLAVEFGWERYSIDTLPDSTALEYKLQSKATRKDGRRAYHSVQGANTDNLTEAQIEELLRRQLRPAVL